MRGGAVGATTAVLAVAAHGAAGGGVPTESSILLLVGVAVVLASVVTAVPVFQRRVAAVPVLLTVGQVTAHLALTVGAGHHLTVAPAMLAAHGIAIALCGILIVAAERVGPAAAAAVRSVVAVLLTPVRAVGGVAVAPAPVAVRSLATVLCRTCAPRRGPPVLG